MESVGQASTTMAGPLVCGAIIDGVGLGAAFAFLAVLLCLSAVLMVRVTRPVAHTQVGPTRSFADQARVSFGLLRRSPALASMLGVTVVVNLFYFSFTPIVPVMAERLHAGPLLTGALGAMAGCGSLAAGVVILSRRNVRPGRLYVAGAAIALTGLGFFAVAPRVGPALLALLVAGAGSAGFSTTQSVLAMRSAGPTERGAALGLLSMAIGSLPLGMLVLGADAQLIGPHTALLVSSLVGLAALTGLLWWRPQVLGPPAETGLDDIAA
jgi:hypothetical protein